MNKRVPVVKQKVKKSGSLDSASDRSISPNDILEVKENENKPNIIHHRQQIKRSTKATPDKTKTGITKPKPTTKTSLKTANSNRPSPIKHTKGLHNANNTKLLSPRPRTGTPTVKPSQKDKTSSPSSPASPTWKVPSVTSGIGKASPIIRALPGRGGPKKLRKVYNPPSLFSLCRTAVSAVITPPEVDEEVKDFVKRRLYNQALMGTIWATLTKETKKNRISIETLISERDELSTELRELKATLNNQITTLTTKHHNTLANTTNSLVSKHDNEIKLLKEDYENTISDLRSQLSQIGAHHENELSYVRETHALEIATLHRDHEQQRGQLIADHEAQVIRLEGTQKDLEEQNEYLDSQIKEKDDNCKIEVAIQLEKQVQRYATINAELQSLNDVIDIKSKENKKLNKSLAEMGFKVEEVTTLRHDINSLRDTNEQLRATIGMKTDSERNLNVTQEKLCQEILLRENDRKNISQKCEELQYKLEAYEEVLCKNNLQENLGHFTPNHFSTPLNSPLRQMSVERDDYISSPKPIVKPKSKAKVRLFDAADATAEILPIHE